MKENAVMIYNSRYVFPYCHKYEKEISQIKNINRLFAFPNIPTFDNKALVILDSGAFALSQSKKKITSKYMFELSEYYHKYSKQYNNILCIAPDVFKNPLASISNIKKWRYFNLYKNITPVLQNSQSLIIDKDELIYQIDFYASLGYKTLCYSIFGANAILHKQQHIEEVFLYAKEKGIKHIHCLGAGWSLEDIKVWIEIKGWDTMDSIAYYATKNINEFGSLNPIENIYSISNIFDSYK